LSKELFIFCFDIITGMSIKLSSEIKLHPKLKTLLKIIMIGFILFLIWLIIDVVLIIT
jgi:hypothetical protein